MDLTSDQLALIVVIFIAIAGVWLVILTYIILSRKRRKPEQLVEEIKKAIENDRDKAKIMPFLNEMMEGETSKRRKRKIKTIKSKAKRIDVSDIADLMSELDTLIADFDVDKEEGNENGGQNHPGSNPKQ